MQFTQRKLRLRYKQMMIVTSGMIMFFLIYYFRIHEHVQDEGILGIGMMRIVKRVLIALVIFFFVSYIFGDKLINKEEAEKVSWISEEEKNPEGLIVFVNLLVGMICDIPFLLILN